MPCFCNHVGQEAKLRGLRPIHVWRRHVCCRVGAFQLLVTEVNHRDVIRVTKTVSRKLEAPREASYISHGFRRGASQEIKERGGHRAALADLGGWRSLAFRGRVDTTADISRDTHRLLIYNFDPDEGGEVGGAPFWWGWKPTWPLPRCAMGVGFSESID